jgi:hypothetical protein
MNDNLLSPRNTNAIAATSTSQTRPLPSGGATNTVGGPTVVFYNDGPGLVFIVTSANSGVVAVAPTLSTFVGTVGHTPIPVGQSHPFQLGPNDQYWAAVSISTSSVYCTRGDGR